MAPYLPSAINSSIKRWTDQRKWSASKDNGPFLVYRELDNPKGPRNFVDIRGNGFIKQRFNLFKDDDDMFHLLNYQY